VVHLRVPPLRERPEDIPVLARHFLSRFEERFGLAPVPLTDALLARLSAYAWPGNVRELEHALESLLALSPDGEPDLSLLPGAAPAREGEASASLTLKQRVDAYERGLVAQALRASGGSRTEAARALGISRVTLHDKLKKYGLGSDSEGP
jgi:two-component system, NtrC family, response regulator HydG